MLHGTLQITMKYEICMSKVSKEIKRYSNKYTVYKVTLFVMLKELKVVYTYMNRMLTVASLLSNSNWGNV